MSTHIHWAAVAGNKPLWQFVKPLHCGFARWLNITDGTFRPVFAERPSAFIVAPANCGRLLAYIHNNPVRAGVALHSDDANISRWTSHCIYTGRDQAPSWLAVAFGLRLAGFDSSAEGRRQFHQFVCAHASQERNPFFCAHTLTTGRVQTRQQLGAPVELATPRLGIDAEAEYPILARPGTPLRPRWSGSLDELLVLVAEQTGISVECVQSPTRVREVVQARRVTLVLGH